MIKILTLLGNNYGGCLQAYALQKKINDLGYEVEQLNYTEYLSKKISIKNQLKKVIYFSRNKKFSEFKKNYLNIGKKITDIKDDGSIYIVGSDQIWNPNIPFDIRKNFFLSFVEDNERKNAYAASIGTDYLDGENPNIARIQQYLSKFNMLTVREKTAEKIIRELNINNVETVLDPTLLLNMDEWLNETKDYSNKNYMFVYTLGLNDKNDNYIDKLSKKLNLKIVDITYKKRFKNTLKVENGFGPIEFISAIKNSEFVITNSFHGTVFSILFHKEFVTITRGDMNSRIFDLLNKLGLQNRIIKEEELENLDNMPFENIDYNKVDDILKKEREKSIGILKKMLK